MVETQCLYLTWASFGTTRTDGRTDRIPIANTRSQQYLPVQLLRVIKLQRLFNITKFALCHHTVSRILLTLCNGEVEAVIMKIFILLFYL